MTVPDGLIRLLTGFVVLIPLSYAMKFLSPKVKFWYSLILGQLAQIYVFGAHLYPIFVQHIIVFAILKWKGPKCGKIVTIQSLLFLSGYHIRQILTNYGGWSLDASALLMILVCKYSLLAYNLEDGVLEHDKCSKEQLKYRVTSDVTLLDFLGYCNFLPSSICGPPLEYNDYKLYIAGSEAYRKIPYDLLHKRLMITFIEAVVMAAIYTVGQTYAPVGYLRNDVLYQQSALYIIWYIFISVFLVRFKYYFGWKLTMCAVHASGVSFNGKDFTRINTVNPVMVEVTPHVREKINYWNISVQEWLRKCVYQRVHFKNKMYNQLFVFMISAFWHGFYGAYYLSFTLWFIQLHMQGLVFKYCKNGKSQLVKLYNKAGTIGQIALSLAVNVLFTVCGGSFMTLRGYYCWKQLCSIYFAPIFILAALTGIFTVVRPPKDTPKDVAVRVVSPSKSQEEGTPLLKPVLKPIASNISNLSQQSKAD